MNHEILELADDPKLALETILEASRTRPVLVFKRSPICPVSHRAEANFRSWLGSRQPADLAIADIDVIGKKPLARGLTAALKVQHESPQALWFEGGDLTWHGSHDSLTVERFDELEAAAK